MPTKPQRLTLSLASIELDGGNIRRDFYPDRPADRELIDSIATNGFFGALQVAVMPNGRHVLIAGHRRRLAAMHCNLTEVPCDIYSCSEETFTSIRLAENACREAESPWHRMLNLGRLADSGGFSSRILAKRTGLSHAAIAVYLESYDRIGSALIKEFCSYTDALVRLTKAQIVHLAHIKQTNEKRQYLMRFVGLTGPNQPDASKPPVARDKIAGRKVRERRKFRFMYRVDNSMGSFSFKFEMEKLSKSNFNLKVSMMEGWEPSPNLTVDELDLLTHAVYNGCVEASNRLDSALKKKSEQAISTDDLDPVALIDTREFAAHRDIGLLPESSPRDQLTAPKLDSGRKGSS